jgi:penicillin-binding protein 1C
VSSPKEQSPKIRYPVDGTILALDPDIPEDRQIVFFEAGDTREGYDWDLDGKRLRGEGTTLPWHPESGNHILSLIDRDGKPLETVRFTVRGSSVY